MDIPHYAKKATKDLVDLAQNPWVEGAAAAGIITIGLIANRKRLIPLAEKVAASSAELISAAKEPTWVADARHLQTEYVRRQALSDKAAALVPANEFRLKGVEPAIYKIKGDWITRSQKYDLPLGARFPIIGDFLSKMPFLSSSAKGRVIEQFNISSGTYNQIILRESTGMNLSVANPVHKPILDGQILVQNMNHPLVPVRYIRWRKYFGETIEGKLQPMALDVIGERPLFPGDKDFLCQFTLGKISRLAIEDGRRFPRKPWLFPIDTPYGLKADSAEMLSSTSTMTSAAALITASEHILRKNSTFVRLTSEAKSQSCALLQKYINSAETRKACAP